MIKRTRNTVNVDSESDALVNALRKGVGAMANPEVEAKVVAYFHENPNSSRDIVHVAAVACRIQDELADTKNVNVRVPTIKTISQSH